jgi:methionine-rich copper-binding protein CopC
MPSPGTSSSSTSVGLSGTVTTDALVGGDKWGAGGQGSGVTLTFSFPWTTNATATFSGPNGVGNYSSLQEQNASVHHGFNAEQQTAARNALASWSSVANVIFSEVPDTSTNVGDIRFAWTSAPNGSNVWGWGSYPNWYWPSAGDIWVSTLSTGATTDPWTLGSYNYEAIMHEIGHALGLKHPFEESPILTGTQDNRLYTIMSYTDPVNGFYPSAGTVNGTYGWITYRINPETPMVYDMAAIQYLYGANTSYHTGDDVYTFDPTKPFFKTIWDAGGSDTISVSTFTLGCEIDLTPGHYSSLRYPPPTNTGGQTPTYDGTNNLGLAYGCIIENAIGSSGNDTLTGSSANNLLQGGPGNDALIGGGGDDTAVYTGLRANYTVISVSGGFTISSPAEGTDTLAGIKFAKFADQTITLGVIDTTPPTVITFSPADEASSVAIVSNIVVTFSEAVQRGTGSILLKTTAGATVVSYDAATSSNLSISGSTLTINPSADLSNNTSYSIEFAAGSIKDIADNSYEGTTSYNFTTVVGSTSTLTLTKAKIYLGVDDSFNISNSGATLYGNSGTDAVTIAVGTSGAVIDQNVERVNFSGASSNYTFKQTGNKINVYDAAGTTLLTSAPVQGNTDGTVLSFSNGVASATIQSGGVMLLGGATVNASAATLLTPTLTISPAPSAGLTKAKVYMGVDDIFTVSSSGTTLYGNSGTDTITIAAGTTNVSLDQNVERINFSGASSSYTFKQTGNKINIYDAAGTTLLASTPVQGDADGTVLSFSNVTASATIQTGGVMKLGTATVSATAATSISLNTVVAVSGTGSAASGDITFNVAIGNYSYSISEFCAGDKIIGPAGNAGTVVNSSFTDGNATVKYALAGQVAQITLTGLTNAQDGSLFGLADLNTLFGAGTIS